MSVSQVTSWLNRRFSSAQTVPQLVTFPLKWWQRAEHSITNAIRSCFEGTYFQLPIFGTNVSFLACQPYTRCEGN